MTDPQNRSISIHQWLLLARTSSAPPVTITLAGDSMRPLIRRHRDRVTIIPVDRPLRRGDIVLIRTQSSLYVVHRIWKKKNGLVRTLGDWCINPEPWMPEEQILGRVVKLQRGSKSMPTDSFPLRIFCSIWTAAYPLRKYCLLLQGKAAAVVRKILKTR